MNINGCSLFSSFVRVLVALLMLGTGVQSAHAERKTTYYHTDGLGSVIAASNEAGTLLWRKEYAPFGEQLDSTAEQEKLAYTGKEHDDVTGLTYFGARYYDPYLGRFMGVDPVGFVESNPMSFNRYAYVNNNPYKYVDPDGEFLNFAAKFVLDVGINVAFNYVTTGEMDVGGALKESAIGIFNPAKTVAKAGKLGLALAKAAKKADRIDPTCVLSCFAAGTTVLAEDGFVAIESLREGDLVWAHDPDTGETHLKPVVRTFVNTKDSVWELTLEKHGVRYRHEVTGSHPYFVVGQGWVEVAQLHVGAVLQAEGESSAIVTGLRDTGEVVTTYNLEVADIHTYYVSAAKVLVHNCRRNLPMLKPGTKAWEAAVETLGSLKRRAADFRTRTATEAKRLLKEARGNMDRRKQYTKDDYRKGYEMHNDQNDRERGVGNDLQHLKWKDGKADGHIFYDKPN